MASAGTIIVIILLIIFAVAIYCAAVWLLTAVSTLLCVLVSAGCKLAARAVARSARSCLRFAKLAQRPGTHHETDSVSTADAAAAVRAAPRAIPYDTSQYVFLDPSRIPTAPRAPPAVAPGGANDMHAFTVTGEPALQACAICLEALGARRIATGPCGHQFHAACIAGWLAHDGTSCPVCRARFDGGARTRHALSAAPV